MKHILLVLCLFSSSIMAQTIFFAYPQTNDVLYVQQDGRCYISYGLYASNGLCVLEWQAKLRYPDGSETNWSGGQFGSFYVSRAGAYKIYGRARGYDVLGHQLSFDDLTREVPFYVVDNYAPAVPTNFNFVNENNHPKIVWSLNSEYDMKDYTLEKKNGPTLDWTVLAVTSSNNYVDQSENLTGLFSHEVWYRVKANDINGHSSNYTNPLEVNVAGVALDKKGFYNNEYELYTNYPNPFNPSTNISFYLLKDGHVSLKIYNTLGQEVANLVNELMESGIHSVTFNAENLNSGIYIYSLQVNGYISTKKMTLIK